jgi:hypothetical protein
MGRWQERSRNVLFPETPYQTFLRPWRQGYQASISLSFRQYK